MVSNNWSKSSLLNFITSLLLKVFCVYFFSFLYLKKLKSTFKYVLHCSHHSLSDVIQPFFISQMRMLQQFSFSIFFMRKLINRELFSTLMFCINTCLVFKIHISLFLEWTICRQQEALQWNSISHRDRC